MNTSTATLIDSDVLIWLLRGNAQAAKQVAAIANWSISAITYMELVQGCRNKAELRALQKTFRSNQTDVLQLTPDISEKACALVEQFALSHSVHMADALIAATAIAHGLTLLTGNAKHFAAIDGLQVVAYTPK